MKLSKIFLSLLVVSCFLLGMAACETKEGDSSLADDSSSTVSFADVSDHKSNPAFDSSAEQSDVSDDDSDDTSEEVKPTLIGTWEWDEDITDTFKADMSANPVSSGLVGRIDMKIFQTHRYTFTGNDIVVTTYIKNAILDEFFDKIEGTGITYDDLQLERYDGREATVRSMTYSVKDGKIFLNEPEIYYVYTLTATELKITDTLGFDGSSIGSKLDNATFKKLSDSTNLPSLTPYIQ